MARIFIKNTDSEQVATRFAINGPSPYILTSLIKKTNRLIYMSSGLHRDGDSGSSLSDFLWELKA